MNQNKGLLEDQLLELKGILADLAWMAIRYAHGRHTTVPSTVRMAVKKIKEIYPDFYLGKDNTIKPPDLKQLTVGGKREDYLDDLYESVYK